jgi:hypothetical protein
MLAIAIGVVRGDFMKVMSLAGSAMILPLVFAPALAADDMGIERLATCQDSWLDWKTSEPAKLQKFGDEFRSKFSQHGNDAFVVPKTDTSIAGLHVTQVFPESVGMGVGFSVTVDASFAKARAVLERMLGRSLGKCETSDGMQACELEIAEKRTITLMAEDSAKNTTTLIGCYYLYEK